MVLEMNFKAKIQDARERYQKDKIIHKNVLMGYMLSNFLEQLSQVGKFKIISITYSLSNIITRFPETAKIRKKLPRPDTIFFEKGIPQGI